MEANTEKMMTKLEQKRLAAHQERRKRLVNRGVSEDKVDAVMAVEDYNNLPLEKKFQRLESLVAEALKEFKNDINSLQHNDTVIAQALDINLVALAKMLESLGVSKETQQSIIKITEEEILAAHNKQLEVSTVTPEQELAKIVETNDSSAQVEVPEAATVFGG